MLAGKLFHAGGLATSKVRQPSTVLVLVTLVTKTAGVLLNEKLKVVILFVMVVVVVVTVI